MKLNIILFNNYYDHFYNLRVILQRLIILGMKLLVLFNLNNMPTYIREKWLIIFVYIILIRMGLSRDSQCLMFIFIYFPEKLMILRTMMKYMMRYDGNLFLKIHFWGKVYAVCFWYCTFDLIFIVYGVFVC